MFETKQNAVRSTIQATLKTLVTLITDKFVSEYRTSSNKEESKTSSPEKTKTPMEKRIVY